jgi:hypothetical protein
MPRGVIPQRYCRVVLPEAQIFPAGGTFMKTVLKALIPIALLAAMTGCVVAPYGGYHRGYYGYGPRVAVVAPAPVVVVRP